LFVYPSAPETNEHRKACYGCIEATAKIICCFDYFIALHFILTALKPVIRKYINND